MPLQRSFPGAALLALLVAGAGVRAGDGAAPAFESEVRPILEKNCLVCHSGESPQAELDLRTPESLLKGGKSGPAIEPGAADRSLLVAKIASGAMPPGDGELSSEDIQRIRGWIDRGAELQEHAAAQLVTEKDVLPIFQMRCVTCHGKSRQKGGLDLRTIESRLAGGKSGPALVPGKPEESLLYQRIAAQEMPPPEMLFDNNVRPPSAGEVETIRRWIEQGARPEPEQDGKPEVSLVSGEDRDFWAFQPPRRPAVPEVEQKGSVRNPIDAFLLARLEEKGLSFSPPAGKLELMRRLYLDLIGMPPTAEEIERYLADERPGAYERLVGRLLNSPHYGERWAQMWLDVAGYADSEGVIHADKIRPHSWRYRDYVIRALNRNLPYDQFLTEQLAADELISYQHLDEVTPEVINRLAATGFLRLTPDGTYSPANGSIAERMNVIADEIVVLSSAVMGLTAGCARCHDHKYDPIPQRDYYRLSAILQTAYDPYDWKPPTERYLEVALPEERAAAEKHNAPVKKQIKQFEASRDRKLEQRREQLRQERLAALPPDVRRKVEALVKKPRSEWTRKDRELAREHASTLKISRADVFERFDSFREEFDELEGRIREARQQLTPEPEIRALYDMGGEPSPVYLLQRGEAQNLGGRVRPGVPEVLQAGIEPYQPADPPVQHDSSGNRLALARWLTQPNHPLTARVMVNRIWMHRFGRGIVETPSNFGRTGAPPSHPKLLDWLATEFVRRGWSVKAMHRLMVTSAAYRQTSRVSEQAQARDPENVLLSRMPLRRMEAEVLHDSILRATGRLDPQPFGPPVEVEVLESGEIIASHTKAGWRRAIYHLKRRKQPVTMLEVFDMPRMSPNCTHRAVSTVATQALQMLNGDTARGHARYLAGRLLDELPGEPERQIEQLYLRVFSRYLTAEERRQAQESLAELTAHWRNHLEREREAGPREWIARWSALGSVAHALLSSAEFVYID